MKYLLIYFTGTHNTRYLTSLLKRRLELDSNEVDTIEIRCETEVVSTEIYDYIGLAYPIYGFNSPLPFNKYLRKLAFTKNQKYFIYKNSGEVWALNNASSRVIKRIMKKKKCRFMGEYHFVMPYNIHFRYPDEFISEALSYDKKLIEVMLYNIDHEIIYYPKSNVFYDIASIIVSIQKIGGNINSFFYRVDNKKCNRCGLCIKNCPHKNISLKNKNIHFSHHCDMCMACSFFCPKDAIKIGFLEKWHVNGEYKFDQIEKIEREKPYITEETKGFFKCFYRYFNEIDMMYDNIYNILSEREVKK